jgi:serine/threonine-protein kinase RsbW
VEARFKIASNIHNIRKASLKVLGALEPFKVSESDLFDIRLCVEEALRNAVVHGNRTNKSLPVTIGYHIDKDKFEAVIEDEGKGFDYKRLADPTKKANLLKLGGRGVYLIRALMDKVEFNDKGNRITMTKYIRASQK